MKNYLYRFILRFIPDFLWIKIQFRRRMGTWPNLNNPKTFNEKIQWLKLHDKNPLYTTLVDKLSVRNYIADTIGEKYLIPLLGVWNNFDEIDFSALPPQFVLKCTHDSGGLVICSNKAKLNIDSARKKINNCLRFNYYWALREWPYKNVKPRIIAEKFMANNSATDLLDYKVHCFNGLPKFILVCSNRNSKNGLNEDFFSPDWEKMDLHRPAHPNSEMTIQRPKKLDEMLSLSKRLSKNFRFLRCDFYEINGKLFFGEITLYPSSGMQKFVPDSWDSILGTWTNLE